MLKFLSVYAKILKRQEARETQKQIENLSSEEVAAYEQRERN